jgi:hypothetical protein
VQVLVDHPKLTRARCDRLATFALLIEFGQFGISTQLMIRSPQLEESFNPYFFLLLSCPCVSQYAIKIQNTGLLIMGLKYR